MSAGVKPGARLASGCLQEVPSARLTTGAGPLEAMAVVGLAVGLIEMALAGLAVRLLGAALAELAGQAAWGGACGASGRPRGAALPG